MKKMIPAPMSAPKVAPIGSGVCVVDTGTVGTVEGMSGAWIFTIPPLAGHCVIVPVRVVYPGLSTR